jgi:histidyl-tRNA synthetase
MSFEAPRGTHDVLPADWPRWQRVLDEAERLCRAYGYRRMVTPTFEETELFARTSGEASDIVSKEMYSFEDRGGRSLTLRPEATAQVCRAYVEHGMHREPQPVKVWVTAPMFRYAKPQKGRYREFWQLNVEAIGSADPALDAELIALQAELLGRLGIETTLLLNSIGDRACRPAYVERLEAWLDEHETELDGDARQKRATSPLRVFDTKNAQLAALLEQAPRIDEALCDDCREHFTLVRDYLDGCGVAYTIAPRLVRGLDYYTRTTFEFVAGGLGAQDTISAGGRYDYLVEAIGGDPIPGVGFATGLERVVMSLEERSEPASGPEIDVFFAIAGTDARESRHEVVRAVMALRNAGISAELDFGGRSLNGQLKHAARFDPYITAVVSGVVATLRKRHAGREQDETLSLDPPVQLVSRIQQLVGSSREVA